MNIVIEALQFLAQVGILWFFWWMFSNPPAPRGVHPIFWKKSFRKFTLRRQYGRMR